MPSKVFISWGGDLSKRIAEELCQWLPSVLQFVKPYFSPDDIEKGGRWESSIAAELSETNVGLICLTPDNLQRPWILFEAGALSKNLDRSYVCPILFNVEPTSLFGPLASFQSTLFKKDDFWKLIQVINSTGGDYKLNDSVLKKVFEKWWPDFEININEILSTGIVEANTHQVSDGEMLKELLSLVRMNSRNNATNINYACKSLERLLMTIDDILVSQNPSDLISIEALYPSIEMLCDSLNCQHWFQEHINWRRRIGGLK